MDHEITERVPLIFYSTESQSQHQSELDILTLGFLNYISTEIRSLENVNQDVGRVGAINCLSESCLNKCDYYCNVCRLDVWNLSTMLKITSR